MTPEVPGFDSISELRIESSMSDFVVSGFAEDIQPPRSGSLVVSGFLYSPPSFLRAFVSSLFLVACRFRLPVHIKCKAAADAIPDRVNTRSVVPGYLPVRVSWILQFVACRSLMVAPPLPVPQKENDT